MNRSIVVVDDDSIYIEMLCDILQDEGYHVVGCQHSDQALETIHATMPQLVICDLRMESPDSGLGLLRVLRRNAATATMSLIVCSADMHILRATTDELRALNCAVLEKPFSIDTLLATVEQQFDPKEQAA